MIEQLGKSEQLDKKLMSERELAVQGNVNAQEINHDQVCEEFAALLGITKMDRHWKVLLMLRFSGLPIDLALAMAQRRGFLKGVRLHEAQIIETAGKQRLMETLNGKGIANAVSQYRRGLSGVEQPITVAVPGNGHTDQPKDKSCQS